MLRGDTVSASYLIPVSSCAMPVRSLPSLFPVLLIVAAVITVLLGLHPGYRVDHSNLKVTLPELSKDARSLRTPSPPALSDGVVRGVAPIYGFGEGAAYIREAGWHRVTKTLYSRFETVLDLPVLPGATREY